MIPTLDLSRLVERDRVGVERLAVELRTAFETVGFAYVTNHGVEQPVIDAAFAASRAFHDLPFTDKLEIEVNESHRGYIPINTSTVVTSTVAKTTGPNQSASLMIMHESQAGSGAGPLDGPNQWPASLPHIQAPLQEYGDALEQVARSLVAVIEVALGANAGELTQHFELPTTFLRLLHYPADPERDPALFGSAPHSDYGFLRLLAQDDIGGLQVRTPGGEWVDVEPRSGTFVLNAADILHRWSNGRLISTPHRVLATTTQNRYSIPYFFDPNTNTQVVPLASCVPADSAPHFEPVIYGDYLMQRLRANHDQHQSDSSAD